MKSSTVPGKANALPAVPTLLSWSDGPTVIAATGESLSQLESIRGKARLLAVSDACYLAPWADAMYACDGKWWKEHKGCPDFPGPKWTQDLAAAEEFGLNYIPIEKNRAGAHLPGFSRDPRFIRAGGNSGYQALNLAVLFGAKRIILLGFDMKTVKKKHFFGDHPGTLNRAHNYQMWIDAFREGAKDISDIEVLNCTPGSALDAFPKANIEDVL